MQQGKVPHFTMRPHPAVITAFFLVLLIGPLTAMSFFSQEDGTGIWKQRGILTFIITGILCLFLVILATAKFWHTHLWKKNSTHARHHNHTKHHPAMREKQFREQQQSQKI
ncbi:hypothetical protein [Pontiella agarivorans]|uniref:Uncharacterized protein n=1 Tax=Pontiella agarivorans TaxID=3038953 RepID=A0ABU5MZD3_9BACT|nr:hypothetical protein [Pontiella agarivorans]MDZ8119565.1 hypothetical protein [Pontiella agarivorans]